MIPHPAAVFGIHVCAPIARGTDVLTEEERFAMQECTIELEIMPLLAFSLRDSEPIVGFGPQPLPREISQKVI